MASRVLILDNCIDPGAYGPVGHWSKHIGCEVESVRPPLGESPADLARYSHIIVSGSEASINEDLGWIVAECDLVKEAAARRIPVLASCFGHQLVVRALSGKQHVRRSPTPEFGWVEINLHVHGCLDEVFGHLAPSVWAYSAHFDEACPPRECWQCLASSPRCPNAIIRHWTYPVWGIQHHPEIEPEAGKALLQALLAAAPPERRDLIMSCYQPQVRDSYITGEVVKRFLAL